MVSMLAIGDDELTETLHRVAAGERNVRARLFLQPLMTQVFERLSRFVSERPNLRVGYSVKTNPRAELMREALRRGFYSETISGGEVEQSLANGFAPERIIYNGPNPATRLTVQPKYVFADSVEAFAANCRGLSNSIVGVRLRPPRIPSRFGVPPGRLEEFIAAVRASGREEIAVSFQVRAEDYGAYDFRGLIQTTVETAQRVERETGARVVAFDAGGGHSPSAFDELAKHGELDFLCEHAGARLSHVREYLIEPGQELDLSLEALIAPVLEVRSAGEGPEIVIDAGHPDFPYLREAPHRFYLKRGSRIEKLTGGSGRIVGRSCLEEDIVSQNVSLPTDIGTGDAIIVADVGAYDASTQYAFAQGFISGNTTP